MKLDSTLSGIQDAALACLLAASSRLAQGIVALVIAVCAGGHLNTAYASSGYACFDQPCSQERQDYVDRWERRVCSHSRMLESLLRRKARGQNTRAQILGRLNRCLALNPQRPGRCTFHARRLRNIDSTLSDIQRRIDRLVARLQGACNASLPPRAPGNAPTCEEREAVLYCPIGNEQQAQQSVQRRCADLRAEKARQALCGNCVAPDAFVAAAARSAEVMRMASTRPTCAPFPTSTPRATPVPEVTPTAMPGRAIEAIVTPKVSSS
jgi:hypothetical protein